MELRDALDEDSREEQIASQQPKECYPKKAASLARLLLSRI